MDIHDEEHVCLYYLKTDLLACMDARTCYYTYIRQEGRLRVLASSSVDDPLPGIRPRGMMGTAVPTLLQSDRRSHHA